MRKPPKSFCLFQKLFLRVHYATGVSTHSQMVPSKVLSSQQHFARACSAPCACSSLPAGNSFLKKRVPYHDTFKQLWSESNSLSPSCSSTMCFSRCSWFCAAVCACHKRWIECDSISTVCHTSPHSSLLKQKVDWNRHHQNPLTQPRETSHLDLLAFSILGQARR